MGDQKTLQERIAEAEQMLAESRKWGRSIEEKDWAEKLAELRVLEAGARIGYADNQGYQDNQGGSRTEE